MVTLLNKEVLIVILIRLLWRVAKIVKFILELKNEPRKYKYRNSEAAA